MSSEAPNSEASLRTLVAQADALRRGLDELQSSSAAHLAQLRRAIAAYEECLRLADAVALFSDNESLDDLPTSSLRCMPLAFHLGNLLGAQPANAGSSSSSSPLQARKEHVGASRAAYVSFLDLLNSYGLLDANDRKLYARLKASLDAQSNGGATPSPFFSLIPQSADPAARRALKIDRFRREKELQAQIDAQNERIRRLNSRHAGGGGDEGGDDDAAAEAVDDDELLRPLTLAQLTLQAHQAFHALDGISQELAMLAMAPDPSSAPPANRSTPDQNPSSNGSSSSSSSAAPFAHTDRLDPSSTTRNPSVFGGAGGPLLSSKGIPLQPFTLLDARARLAEGVFRPGHSLPTMSIDEYLEAERARGGIIEGGGEKSGERRVVDEDDHAAADAETVKQREWDEFVEENPRGSGNTLNMG